MLSPAPEGDASQSAPRATPRWSMLLDGRWVNALTGDRRTLVDPADASSIAEVPEAGRDDALLAIDAARRAFDHGPWRGWTPARRARLLYAVADRLRADADALARLEVQSCGKPLAEAVQDVADAAGCFDHYAGLAARLGDETMIPPTTSLGFTLREPVGVCAQIIPWNYPLVMAAWKLAPALAAGCTAVLKPSELTPLSALALARILVDLDLPPGVVNVITGPGPGCGEVLTESPKVDKIAFTGGTATGARILEVAGRTCKRVTLELGGKSPNLIFADADLEAAIDGAILAAFANQGEVCSAGSRLLVEASIHDAVVDGLVARARALRLGPGLDPATQMGPLVSGAHRERVEGFVALGLEEGARLRCGGRRPDDPALARGFFYAPTIFDQVRPSMRIAREEVFGPVLCVIPFDTEAEAIEIANDTIYGLAAGVWTADLPRALRVVKAIRAGVAWINTYGDAPPDLPWGGCKQSGLGRELGPRGLDAYLEVRQVHLRLPTAATRRDEPRGI